jgi:hypothetical protein
VDAALAIAAAVAALAVAGYAATVIRRWWRARRVIRRVRVPPHSNTRTETVLYRSRRVDDAPTHSFWNTTRPNRTGRRRWGGRRNRGGTYPD